MKYKRIKVDDYTMFYRECGDITKPVFLYSCIPVFLYSCIPVLHGFPSASHMFRNLMPLLENTFYCIAPIILALRILLCRRAEQPRRCRGHSSAVILYRYKSR